MWLQQWVRLRIMNDRNFDFLDILTVFSVVLQVMGYQDDMRRASNDDLMQELQKQDKEYLTTIIQNQELILEKLAQLESK